jgi:hypothetical protein
LGGAFSGVLQGDEALFGNPAGLSSMQGLGAGLHYQSWLADVSDETAYLASGFGAGLGLGAYAHITDYGSFELRDSNGQRQGNATARDVAFGVGGGVASGDLGFGVSARMVHQDLVGEQSWALGVDAGMAWERGATRVGLAAMNVGTALDGNQGAESVRLGVSQRIDMGGAQLLPAIGAQWDPQGYSRVQAGAELRVNHALALRGGYEQRLGDTLITGLQGMTLGLGFKLGSVSLDYAYLPFGDLGAGHRLSLGWQASPRAVDPSAQALSPVPAPRPQADPLALPQRLIKDGRQGEALAELQRLCVERPSDAMVWRTLGQLQWQMAQRPQALASLRMAQSLVPDPSLAAWLQQVDSVFGPPGSLEKP